MNINEPIVLATGNPKKVLELREIMGEIGVEIISLSDLGMQLAEPEENGATFEENARIKALGYAEQTGRLCLADDSGLVVDALNGEPGVYSARYSSDIDPSDLPREERDALNIRKLLDALGEQAIDNRRARFVCAMCLAGPTAVKTRTNVLAESIGTFEGSIGIPKDVPRGDNGFGYDPIFLVAPEFSTASAELSPEVKNSLSHRGKASRLMADKIQMIQK
jgi:XTP/dITP diphosphohydrolase